LDGNIHLLFCVLKGAVDLPDKTIPKYALPSEALPHNASANQTPQTQQPYVGTAIPSFREGWDMGYHAHSGIEISVVLEGKGYFQCEGIETAIEKGDIVLIQPHMAHRYWTISSSIRFGVFQGDHLHESFMAEFLMLLSPEKTRILRFSNLHLENYEALFRIWLRTASEYTADPAKMITVWADLILLYVAENGRPGPALLSVAAAAEYIRTQADGELKVNELAKLCGLSDSTFRRAFHSAYGMAPKQYQQECRMTEAKWLLRSCTIPIQLIAEQVGFASIHAFSSWFHQKVGTPASEWRKAQHGTLSPDSPVSQFE
jgi:AraC family transcriptional regulator